ncbi:MAG: tetratricopeptide repeat protein [Trueperaceae bacterium]
MHVTEDTQLRSNSYFEADMHPSHPIHPLPWRSCLLLAALLLLVATPSASAAQIFDSGRYLRNCLEFERGGDYETARQSCLNALASEPGLPMAHLALGRIELALGNLAAAESELRQARSRVGGAEPQLLLAEVYIRAKRFGEAESTLTEAAQRLTGEGGRSWAAQHAYLRGELAQQQGLFSEALEHFREAVRLEPRSRRNVVELASLLFQMRSAAAAEEELRSYVTSTGAQVDAEVSSLLGRVLWAQGELAAAAGELEDSLAQRTSREATASARDLRALGLVYYGMGDYQAGGLALREATRRGNLLATFFSGNLLWLLLVLLLLAVLLVGESRLGSTSNADTSEEPRYWTTSQVYAIGLAALLAGLPIAVTYGYLRYENLLALVTPIQNSDTLAVFYIVFAVVASWGAWRRTASNGWAAGGTLLGGSERVPTGVFLGLAMLAGLFAYRQFVPPGPWRGEFFLDLAHLTPAVAAAMVLIPLSEIFFRGFAFPAFENRYGGTLALLISGSLSALVFATPIVFLLPMGLVLAAAYRSTRSSALTFAAQSTFHIGLLLVIEIVPLARSLFV